MWVKVGKATGVYIPYSFRTVAVADLGEGPGPPLLLDQTEALRAETNFFGDRSPLISGSGWPVPPLSEGLDPPLSGVGSFTLYKVSVSAARWDLRFFVLIRED